MTKRKYKTTKVRRDYCKKYYEAHKEKYQQYQRNYNAERKRKRGGKKGFVCKRALVREAFTPSDIMNSHDGQTVKILEKIISGKRMLVI